MHDILTQLFDTSSFIPHGHCYLWKPGLVWLHLISDAIIALAYYSIPLTLFYFVRKRKDLPFYGIFLLFAAFIIFCGTTHIVSIWTLWYPTYWISGLIKAGTAVISLFTAIELIPLVPQALALPSPTQLQEANEALHSEIDERLRIEKELRQLQDELEQRVQTRTAELVQLNQQLQQEIDERQRAEADRDRVLKREQAARAEAEAANRIKDEFLAVLSHELRTPLSPILGWVRMLQSGTLDAQKQAIGLETIERNAKLQTQLIEDLLDISRILQGKLTLDVKPVDLANVISAAKETILLAAEAKSIQIQTELESPGRFALGDPNRLQQVIWNLLSNAVKFTPADGQIQIKLTYEETIAQITVKDSGKGISSEFLPYVFEYFRQADSSITRRFGGLGLGLAIARQIVELHGGTVTAGSAGEGQGATFIVQLPLPKVASVRNPIDRSPLRYSNLSGVDVLVVEDESDTRELIKIILEEYGATVTAVASAEEALLAFIQRSPDILVSDIGMPDIDGYSFISQIRLMQEPHKNMTPAIALTAYAGAYNQQQALQAGFQTHLAKPVDPEVLAKAISSLVNQSIHQKA
ncbi:MAG: response regulator [Leptolyngbyaceae cyanobacterium SM1_3_5]|nr:response regulator [Leptolyngbyaceae cyanobacterium SM1_3_5]